MKACYTAAALTAALLFFPASAQATCRICNCSRMYFQASVGSGVPARVRRMASRAPMARRRAVSITERMSA